LIIEAIRSYEISIHTRATQCKIPEDGLYTYLVYIYTYIYSHVSSRCLATIERYIRTNRLLGKVNEIHCTDGFVGQDTKFHTTGSRTQKLVGDGTADTHISMIISYAHILFILKIPVENKTKI
jgi:hypothetical protein